MRKGWIFLVALLVGCSFGVQHLGEETYRVIGLPSDGAVIAPTEYNITITALYQIDVDMPTFDATYDRGVYAVIFDATGYSSGDIVTAFIDGDEYTYEVM